MQLNGHIQKALSLHQGGRLDEAEAIYKQVLRIDPRHLNALYLSGVVASQAGQFAVALDFIDRALEIRPDLPELHSKRGDALNGLLRCEEAVASFDRAINLKPDFAEAYANRGNALVAMGKIPDGLESFEQALSLQSDLVEAHFNRGLAFHSLGRYSEAVESFEKAVLLRPDFGIAHVNRGISLYSLRRYENSIESIEKAILLNPDFPEAYLNLGNALLQIGRAQDALASFDQAIRLMPAYIEAHNNRANALNALGEYLPALESLKKVLSLRPNYAPAYNTRANALLALHRYLEALDACETAIQIDPNYAEAYSNRSSAYLRMQRPEDALGSLNKAIQLNPELAEPYNNHGAILMQRQQYSAALEKFDHAILLKPHFAEAHANRGMALFKLAQYRSAAMSFNDAFRLAPADGYSQSMKLFSERFICHWTKHEKVIAELEAAIEHGERVAIPFPLLAISDSLPLQQKAAEIFIKDQCAAHTQVKSKGTPNRGRFRIGYFSADFYGHATSYLTAELFERHDRSRFEIIGFSFGPDIRDAMRERIERGMDRFIDVRGMSDREVAHLSRDLAVDIAVDLNGLTQNSQPGIFAERAADLQVNYLGYPGTMGAEFMDYLIADRVLIPERSRRYFTERIIYLPDSYQVNDSTRRISQVPCTRKDEGLPERGFVFCCLNSNWKISPQTFHSWMRILKAVSGSLLWLLNDHPDAIGNLRAEASSRGISPERLVFAQRLPPDQHLARHQLADLFLDTSPYGAHTTASDALWAGLPLLTYAGESFASRVGASLLTAVGLPELVATTESGYEELAVELALNPKRLAKLRHHLGRMRGTAPLFDTARFTGHLEDAYSAMIERQQAGLPPDHLAIAHRHLDTT